MCPSLDIVVKPLCHGHQLWVIMCLLISNLDWICQEKLSRIDHYIVDHGHWEGIMHKIYKLCEQFRSKWGGCVWLQCHGVHYDTPPAHNERWMFAEDQGPSRKLESHVLCTLTLSNWEHSTSNRSVSTRLPNILKRYQQLLKHNKMKDQVTVLIANPDLR